METHFEDAIRSRYSVRSYLDTSITPETRSVLLGELEALRRGPLGSNTRFSLVAATSEDRASLRGLGTYGFIKNPAGFILGAVEGADHALEDFGYMMEYAILTATALGLGTCWLGGSFTQSSFAEKMGKRAGEIMPAVAATGYPVPHIRERDLLRRGARSDTRLAWETLFFESAFHKPLPHSAEAGNYALALEMVRLAPSASNKQPWRVVKNGTQWHFYCQRTPGYGQGSWYFNLLRLADLQRLDIGIAMCHFDLTVQQLGLPGDWSVSDPGLELLDEKTLYIATWNGAGF